MMHYTSVILLSSALLGMLHNDILPMDVMSSHMVHSRLQHMNAKLDLLWKAIWKLACEKEVKCDAAAQVALKYELDKLYMQEASPERNYTIAKKLATFVHLSLTDLTSEDAGRNIDAVINETEMIIGALEKHLASRGINQMQRALRQIKNYVSPYKHLVLMAGIPLGAYATYSVFDSFGPLFNMQAENKNNEHLSRTWSFCEKAFLALFIKELYRFIETESVQETMIRGKDYIKSIIARALAIPFRSSNPASSSKIALNDVPVPITTKNQMHTLANFVAQQEAIIKMGGSYPKGILVTGDPTIAWQLANGLASEITAQSKIAGTNLTAMVATIHASKLSEESFRKLIERIKNYNGCCVILIQDLDWIETAYDETRTKIIADLLGNIKSTIKPYESYVIIGTAQNRTAIDPLLTTADRLELQINLDPAHDRILAQACVDRIAHLYNIIITNSVLNDRLVDYVSRTSFDALKSLIGRAYTKALPQLAEQGFNESSIIAELDLIEAI